MDEAELQKAVKQIQAADVIFAETRGGKLDGKFVPVWIAERVVAELKSVAPRASLNAVVFRIVIDEAAIAEIMKANVMRVKGPSAPWPRGLAFHVNPDGTYVAKFGTS